MDRKKIPFVDLNALHAPIQHELDAAIQRVMQRGQFILGEEVSLFEQNWAHYTGAKHCVTCANGTDALELALEVLGIGEGDEVILAAFGWISGSLAVKRVGATPVFVDIHPGTFHITEEEVAPAITAKTKAIIAVHLFGQYNPLEGILELCQKHDLRLIEDCAQAHGLFVEGKHVGNFGDIGTFSFYPTKNLGCLGDGGGLITNNDEWAKLLHAKRDYGRVNGAFVYEGRNSRLDELQAAILNVKLPYLDSWNEKRREVAKWYAEVLRGVDIRLPDETKNVFYRYAVLLENNHGPILSSIHQLSGELGLDRELGKYMVESRVIDENLFPVIFPVSTFLNSQRSDFDSHIGLTLSKVLSLV